MNNFGINVLDCFEMVHKETSYKYLASINPYNIDHSHDYYQYIYVLEHGNSTIRIDHIDYTLKQGDIYIIKSNILHKYIINQTTKTFELKFMLSNNNLLEIANSLPVLIQDTDNIIICILNYIHDEYKKNMDDELLFLKIYELLLTMKRLAYKTKNTKLIPNYSSSLITDKNEFTQVIDYIQKHYTENISRNELANIMCIDQAYFSKKFKNYFKITPTDFLNEVRVLHAVNFLEYTNMSISQISERIGFKNQNSFSKLFKIKFGMTPIEYKKYVRLRIIDKYIDP